MAFMENIMGELSVTDEDNFDPNNNADYTIANCMLNDRPGFTKTDGYDVELRLLMIYSLSNLNIYQDILLHQSLQDLLSLKKFFQLFLLHIQ